MTTTHHRIVRYSIVAGTIAALLCTAAPALAAKKDPAPAAPSTATASTSSAAATATAANNSGSVNVYASTLFTREETQNLLALALALGALGLVLTSNRILARTMSGINGLFNIQSSPQPSSSRA